MANPDVFVSYSSEDRPRVEPIVQRLVALDLNVWWDRELQIGDEFRHVIGEMLYATRVVIVFWSHSSVVSQFVIDEAEEGLRRGILLPARLDKVDAPLGLRGWQYADLFVGNKQYETTFDSLVEAVQKLLKMGMRPERRWWNPLSISTEKSISGVDTLEKLSIDVRIIANLLTTDPEATISLKKAVNEVYRTYAAVRDAIDKFGSLQGRKGIRLRPLKSIAKGRLSVEVNERRGHCTAIGLAYFGNPGIRSALVRASVADLKSLDDAFTSLSTADGDAFRAMTEITVAMAGEASAIVNHLSAGQKTVAQTRLSDDVSQLSRLEAKLNEQITALLAFAGEFGITIDEVP